jgi:hypothetical protein
MMSFWPGPACVKKSVRPSCDQVGLHWVTLPPATIPSAFQLNDSGLTEKRHGRPSTSLLSHISRGSSSGWDGSCPRFSSVVTGAEEVR